MKASTILFLVFCAWFYVFQMTPVQSGFAVMQPGEPFCGTVSPGSSRNRSYTQDQSRGKILFDANCARCHNAALEKKGTGPALLGVSSRIPDGEWIYNWVHNSSKLIQSGDLYAKKVYEANGKVAMDPFPALSNQDIDAIMAWIDGY